MMWLVIITACVMFVVGLVIGVFLALMLVGDNESIDTGIKD